MSRTLYLSKKRAGIELLRVVVADNIGMDENEIIDNWKD